MRQKMIATDGKIKQSGLRHRSRPEKSDYFRLVCDWPGEKYFDWLNQYTAVSSKVVQKKKKA